MKRIIRILIITIPLGILVLLIVGIGNKISIRERIKGQLSRLPMFSFVTYDGTIFNSSNISTGPVLVVRFHPDCEHCQDEMSEISKSAIPESGTKVILITDAPRDTVIHFMDQYRLSERNGIIVLFDTAYVFSSIFGTNIIPTTYIYGRDLKLIKVLSGVFRTETITRYLEQGE